MTALCSGSGPSSERSGYGATVGLGSGIIAGLFSNVPTALAAAVGGYIGLVTFELSTFCNTDPPPLVIPTLPDWVSLVTVSDPVGHAAAVQLFQDYVANMVWPIFCKCNSDPQPTPAAPPTPPAGLPQINPPALSPGPEVTPCWDKLYSNTLPGSAFEPGQDWTPFLVPPAATITKSSGGFTWHPSLIPAGVTALTLVTTLAEAASSWVFAYDFYTSAGTLITGGGVTYSAGQSGTRTTQLSIPGNAAYWTFIANDDTVAHTPIVELTYFCPGQSPGNPSVPCCPPDPILSSQLDQITALLNSLYQSTPTIVSSYADSTVHAGLTGNNAFALGAGTLVVRVEITSSLPATVGEATGDPVELFSAGWITFQSDGAPWRSERLQHSPQLFAAPQLANELHYTFAPGVTASVTELVRGP